MTTNPSAGTGPGLPARADAHGTNSAGEPLITLDQAAAMFPANTPLGHVGVGTLLRWIVTGKHKIRLEAIRRKGKWYTTAQAVHRFREAARLAVVVLCWMVTGDLPEVDA